MSLENGHVWEDPFPKDPLFRSRWGKIRSIGLYWEIKAQRDLGVYVALDLCILSAPHKGLPNFCRAKAVEKTVFDTFWRFCWCNLSWHFWCFLTWPLSAGPFCGHSSDILVLAALLPPICLLWFSDHHVPGGGVPLATGPLKDTHIRDSRSGCQSSFEAKNAFGATSPSDFRIILWELKAFSSWARRGLPS